MTLPQALYRDAFYLLVALIGVVHHGSLLAKADDPASVLNAYSGFADNPVFWWTLIELITLLTNTKRRAVHNFMAKSVVVRTETSS